LTDVGIDSAHCHHSSLSCSGDRPSADAAGSHIIHPTATVTTAMTHLDRIFMARSSWDSTD
jgi:hypothetical protein